MRRSKLAVAIGAGAALVALGSIWQGVRRAYDLRGKVVVVTGGSRGLGLVLARRLAERRAVLVLLARDADELAHAREELRRGGATVLALRCDVTDPADVRDAITIALDWYGRIDVVVNNAGVIEVGPMETMTVADYEQAMRTHFWGPLHLSLEVLPEMRSRRNGRIVNIASIGGVVAVPHLLPYSASKFALVGLSQGMRAELAQDGVYVTTVCPGLMRTGSIVHALFKGDPEREYAWFSVSGSLPVASMNVESAARRIVRAIERGEANVILTPQAKLAAIAHGLFPGLVADALGLVARALPRPDRPRIDAVRGDATGSPLNRSWLTALSRRAALRNNELRS